MVDFEKPLTAIGRQTILCIGDLMLDNFVYGEVLRISPEAPAPVIAVSREDVVVGGAGNVARNIASLGARCLLVGVVGSDPASRTLKFALRARHSRIASQLGDRPGASDDAEAALRFGASFHPSVARRLGAGEAGQRQGRGRADQARARRPAAGRRGGAVGLCQGRADPTADPRGDRAGEKAEEAGHRRSQGHGLFGLSRCHHHHAEPQGAGRCHAPAGGYPRRSLRRRPARWRARSAARPCWSRSASRACCFTCAAATPFTCRPIR